MNFSKVAQNDARMMNFFFLLTLYLSLSEEQYNVKLCPMFNVDCMCGFILDILQVYQSLAEQCRLL